MTSTLQLELNDAHGAVLRVLGLVSRRGFTLHNAKIQRTTASTLSVSLDVSGQRPVDVLNRQLVQLHDVICSAVQAVAPTPYPPTLCAEGENTWR